MIGDMIKLQPDFWRHLKNGLSVVSTEGCEAILRTGRLPINRRNRAIFNDGILRVRHDSASRSTIRGGVGLTKTSARMTRLSGELAKVMQTDAGCRVLSLMKIPEMLFRGTILGTENSTISEPPIDVDQYVKETGRFHHQVQLEHRLLSTNKAHKPNKRSHIAFQNWLFEEFYYLFAELKGARPRNAGPLYRFTIECVKLVGININITEGAFRMRVKRLLSKRRKEIEIFANLQ